MEAQTSFPLNGADESKSKDYVRRYFYLLFFCLLAGCADLMKLKVAFNSDKPLAIISILLLYGASAWYFLRKNKTYPAYQNWILLLAFLVRLVYIWSTHNNISPHDLGFLVNSGEPEGGHLGYISYLFYHGHLPNFDPRQVGGFYNPPLFHVSGTLFMKLNMILGSSFEQAGNNLRVLTLLYTSAATLVFGQILDEFNLREDVQTALLALFALFPAQIWLAATLTSDSLVLLFSLLVILFTLRWIRTNKLSDILALSISLGFGMMTKLNVGLLAVPVASVFITVLIRTIKKERSKLPELLLQFVLFLLICAPLGLFWPLRNKILFDMPLTYVPRLDDSQIHQYIGSASLWQRLGIPKWSQMNYAKLKFDSALDTNIWVSLMRSALFDEGDIIFLATNLSCILGRLFLYLSILLAIMMNICFLLAILRKNKHFKVLHKAFFALFYLTLFGSYIQFCFAYPHICSMNFRYIACLLVVPLVGTGLVLSEEKTSLKVRQLFYSGVAFSCFFSLALYLSYCLAT